MNFPSDLRYTKTHEWVRRDGKEVSVGITDYAQKEISDVVFVELPKTGKQGQAGKPVAVVESVKAAFDIYAPVNGSVTKVNSALEGDPALVNADCYGKGWFFSMTLDNPADWDSLMTKEVYEKSLKTEV